MDIDYIDKDDISSMQKDHLNLINLLVENYNINLNREYRDVKIINHKPILDVYLSEQFTCSIERIFNNIELNLFYPICVLFSSEKVFY